MSVKRQQVTREAEKLRERRGTAAVNRLRGFAGNHSMIGKQTALETFGRQRDETAQHGEQLITEVSAGKPEFDFTYQGQNGVNYYVKLQGGANSLGIAVMSGEETADKVTRKYMKKFATGKDNPFPKSWLTESWMYHEMYGGATKIQFDRWGDILDLAGKTVLKCINVNSYLVLPESVEDVLNLYQSSAPGKKIPGVTYSGSGAGLDPSTGRLSEFVVLLLKDPEKLTHTYMYWNESFSAREKGQPKTVTGEVAYYALDYPSGFEAAWEERESTEKFLTKMDTLLQGKEFTLEPSLKPASYEAYKSATGTRRITEGGQTKTVPISESWGKRFADDPQQIYSKMQPFFPPREMVANFDTAKSDIESMVDAEPEFSKKEFFGKLKDLVAYLSFYPEVTITIEGHTSRKGNDKENIPLSKKRANSVRNYIIAHAEEWSGKSLNGDRIAIDGKGSAGARGAKNDDVADRKIVIRYKVQP